MAAREFVAFGAQAGEDALAVDERLRAAKRNERNARRGALLSWGDVGHSLGLAMGRRQEQGAPLVSSQCQFRPNRHNARRIDATVALVIVMLDVEEIDRLGDAGQVVKLT